MDLSIIIPMYNASRFITKLLDSIYEQDSNGIIFEVIIVDDCSLDNSIQIIEDYITDHQMANLRLLQSEVNGGTASARNRGIEESSGKWIQFVDSDDTIQANYFRLIAHKLNLDIDCYIYGLKLEYQSHVITHQPQGQIDQRMIGYRNSVVNKIYRRHLVNNFEVSYDFEDVIWLVKLIGNGEYRCQLIDDLFYNVNRTNEQSKMANLKQAEWKKMASDCIKSSCDLNDYARAFVLETFVGILFADIYLLRNRLYIAALAFSYNFKYLPTVISDGIRKKSIIIKVGGR